MNRRLTASWKPHVRAGQLGCVGTGGCGEAVPWAGSGRDWVPRGGTRGEPKIQENGADACWAASQGGRWESGLPSLPLTRPATSRLPALRARVQTLESQCARSRCAQGDLPDPPGEPRLQASAHRPRPAPGRASEHLLRPVSCLRELHALTAFHSSVRVCFLLATQKLPQVDTKRGLGEKAPVHGHV